jgi:selenocysteine lyase/cysteine desulfurase
MTRAPLKQSPTYCPGDGPVAEADFIRRFPVYRETSSIDALRAAEYERLDRLGHTYLDYTGGGLYAESQLQRHYALLRDRILGNPHSHNPASAASSELVTEARAAVRRFFNAEDDEYEVIFAANASAALKLVGEAYPFGPRSVYLMSYDNHNSVNGIREFARRKGASVTYVPVTNPELRLDEELLFAALRRVEAGSPRLLAFPAQSNFSGVQHPLEWITAAQRLGWDVLLDCAAFVPTNRLDLDAVKPDFAVLSFYKMFGYPTGVGALIARREKLAVLQRPWFAGGTITVASVQEDGWYRLAPGAAGFEDGTVNYLALPAVTLGLDYLANVGIDVVHARVGALAGWLLDELTSLRHGNGSPLVRVFGPTDMRRRGATIALYLLDPDGHPYDVYGVESAAGERGISIRTGCFCNPGDGEVAHDITHEDMALCFRESSGVCSLLQCQRTIQDATGKVPNTVRVSAGLASNFADAYRFMEFVASYRDRPADES